MKAIVAGSGRNDSGLFETNLRDERYLPFENSGVISEWRLELPANPAADEPQLFDYDTISDVILHIRYTAREGGARLRDAAMGHLKSAIEEGMAAGMARLFSIRHEFPAEWQRFKTLSGGQGPYNLRLNLKPEHYPYWIQKDLQEDGDLQNVYFLARPENDPAELLDSLQIYDDPNEPHKTDTLEPDSRYDNLLFGTLENIELPAPVGQLILYFNSNNLDELWMVISLQGSTPTG